MDKTEDLSPGGGISSNPEKTILRSGGARIYRSFAIKGQVVGKNITANSRKLDISIKELSTIGRCMVLAY